MVRIIIVGGGFGGVYTVRNILRRIQKKENIEVVLMSDKNYFLFKPMMHEVATGGLNRNNIVEPIREIFHHPKFHFIRCEVLEINFNKKIVITDCGSEHYDYIVIAIGARPRFFGISGARENAFPFNSMKDAEEIRNRMIKMLENASREKDRKKQKKLLTFLICGAGPTGVELAGEMQEFLVENLRSHYPEIGQSLWNIALIQRPEMIMPQIHQRCIERSMKELEKKKITVLTRRDVRQVHRNGVTIGHKNKKERLYAETVIWTTGVEPNTIKTVPNVALESGHIQVNDYLEIKGTSSAYSLGDCALFIPSGADNALPALAQTATKQAKYAAHNILAEIKNRPKKACAIQLRGFLVSIGQKFAVAEIGPFRFKGFFAWWLWRTIYLFKLIGGQNKFKVAYEWTLQLFYHRDTSEL